MAFNPITLEYDSSVQGEILKNRDEQSRVKLNFLNYIKYNNYNIFLFSTEHFLELKI